MKLFIILTIHNEYDYLFKILGLLMKQNDINQSDVIVYIIDSSSVPDEQLESKLEVKYKSMNLKYHRVPTDFFWSKMNNFGIKEILKVSNESDLVLFLNVDVKFKDTFIHNIFTLYCSNQSFILSACIRDDVDANLQCGVRIIKKKFKIVDNLVLNNFKKDKYLSLNTSTVSTRATVYPSKIFNNGIRIRHKLLPHYYADLVLGLEAQELGYDIKFHSALQIINTRNPSVLKQNSKLFKRYFGKSSPTRLFSIFLFWSLVLKSEIQKLLRIKSRQVR